MGYGLNLDLMYQCGEHVSLDAEVVKQRLHRNKLAPVRK